MNTINVVILIVSICCMLLCIGILLLLLLVLRALRKKKKLQPPEDDKPEAAPKPETVVRQEEPEAKEAETTPEAPEQELAETEREPEPETEPETKRETEPEAKPETEREAEPEPEPELTLTQQEIQFLEAWTAAFTEGADTFNGLYQGLEQCACGAAKRPERVIKEWRQRTRYRFAETEAGRACEAQLAPLLPDGDPKELARWAAILLKAADASGIAKGETGELLLTEQNVNDYTERDGETLYVGDAVSVKAPAWYQNGALLEQGKCIKSS